MSAELMNASPHEGVERGSCVMLVDGDIIYAGPIKGGPDTAGKLVLLNPADFTKLQTIVDRGRH